MKTNILKSMLVIVIIFIMPSFILLNNYSSNYNDAIEKKVEKEHYNNFKIDDIIYESKLDESSYFVLYYNEEIDDLYATIFSKDVFGYNLVTQRVGLDNYILNGEQNNKTVDFRINQLVHNNKLIHYGEILNDNISYLKVGDIMMKENFKYKNHVYIYSITPIGIFHGDYEVIWNS